MESGSAGGSHETFVTEEMKVWLMALNVPRFMLPVIYETLLFTAGVFLQHRQQGELQALVALQVLMWPEGESGDLV